MSKYIHVDGDDGRIKVANEELVWGIGWIYKVPDDFQFVLTPENLEDHMYVYEILSDHPDAELVHAF